MKKNLFLFLCFFMIKAMGQIDSPSIKYCTQGTISWIKLLQPSTTSSSNAVSFLQNVLANNNTDVGFTLKNSSTDDLGMEHEKYQQTYMGVKVYSGQYIVHHQNGFVVMANGNYDNIVLNSVAPTLTESQALTAALNNINATAYKWQNAALEADLKQRTNNNNATYYPQGELVIIPKSFSGASTDKLCFKFTVAPMDRQGGVEIMIDAITGSVVLKLEGSCSGNTPAKANTMYSGNQQDIVCNWDNANNNYKLEEYDASGQYITIRTLLTDGQGNTTNVTNNNTTWLGGGPFATSFAQDAVLDAHWGAEVTMKYWKNRHHRNSIDLSRPNLGVESQVNYIVPGDNAYWEFTSPYPLITYFLGKNYLNPLVSLDMCAHEIGHGISQYSCGLSISTDIETSAVNESLSDIWAACVENYANQIPSIATKFPKPKEIWQIGEDIVKPGLGLQYPFTRSMEDPHQGFDVRNGQPIESPDCYECLTWNNLKASNNLDPHFANGVMNKWFYLLCEADGSTFQNEIGNTITSLNKINFNEAEDIVYRTVTVYLVSTPKFKDVREASIQAAIDLFGLGSAQEIAVTKAWYAVNVGANYLQTPPAITCVVTSTVVLPTNITKSYNGGTYYMQNNTYIKSNVTFNNSTIYVANGVDLFVTANNKLTLYNCHIFTCTGMWNGITVNPTAKLSINNCLIEDAKVAVYYDDNNTAPAYTAGTKILYFNNTIFNRNEVGIKIENYTADANPAATVYPFNVSNCIFTCRKISDGLGNSATWDNINTIIGSPTTYPETPLSYTSPYITGLKYADNVVSAYLKDVNTSGYTSNKSIAGIVLNNVNNAAATAGIVIGDVNTVGFNIFDNLQYGIKATDANVIINTCSFQKPVGDGVGIFVNESITPTLNYNPNYYINNNFVKINNPSAAAPSNAFFDMNTAIYVGNINNVEITGCEIRSNQNINALAQNGKFGISIGNKAFDQIFIGDNHIYNVRFPISYGASHEGERHKFGALTITGNIIANEISTTAPLANSFVEKAITLGVFFEAFVPIATPISCEGNQIIKAFNGISASGWKARNVSIIGNTIELAADAIIAPNGSHYGVKMEGGNGSTLSYDANGNAVGNNNDNIIRDNTIIGCGITSKNSGIKIALQTNTTIECNKVYKCQDGFRFEGNCPLTKFTDNFIYSSNKNGVYLDETIIGRQGNDGGGVLADICTSNNDWEQDAATWRANLKNMIYNNLTVPTDAEFVVHGNGRFNPAFGGFSVNNLDNYIKGTGLVLVTDPDGRNCTSNRCSGYPKKIKNIQEILEEIAAGTILLPDDEARQRLEVMQQQLYELVNVNPDLATNSTDIQQFMYDNQWQSLDYIYYLGYFAAKGDMGAVNDILYYWLPTGSELDDNYRTYYEWLAAMYNNPAYKPSPEEVLPYANKCPIKNGTIVYAIRNLYNALTETINNFEDNCENNPEARGTKRQIEMIRLKQPKVKQSVATTDNKLLVYPNPSNNYFIIKDNTISNVSIINTLGQEVLNVKVYNYEQKINTEKLPNGFYIVKVINSIGKATTSKLLIQH